MTGESLEKIYDESEKNCVRKILLNSLPLLEHWNEANGTRPTYYTDKNSKFYWNTISDIPTFEEFRKLDAQKKSKFFFLINGFLHFDLGAIDAVKSTIALYSDLPIVGFGEIFGDHDIMSDQMNPPSKINSAALDPIYHLAGERKWFVLLHNNLSHRSFKGPTPADNLKEIEAVLHRHRKTNFILAHGGVMRNIVIADLPATLDSMLRKNQNLYIDLSFVVLENYIMAEGLPSKDWVALLEKYPTRFLFGSDDLGSYRDFFDVKKYLAFVAALTPQTAEKFTHKNFETLVNRALLANKNYNKK
jgi:predicted TIM-barrel fold metal-dependent hydrolase